MVTSIRALTLGLTLLQAGCWAEIRHTNQIYACSTTEGQNLFPGQIPGAPVCRHVGTCQTPAMCALIATYRQ